MNVATSCPRSSAAVATCRPRKWVPPRTRSRMPLTPAEPLPRRPAGSRAAEPHRSARGAAVGGLPARRPGSTGTCGNGVERAAASTICGERGSPRRVHSRSARAPVSTSVSGGTTSRSARREPPSQVRQTTPGSMLRKPPVRTIRPPTAILRGTGAQASSGVGEALDPDTAAVELGDQLGQLDGEVAGAREPGAVEGGVPVAGAVPETHPDIDPAPEPRVQSRSGNRRHQRLSRRRPGP